MRVRMAEMQWRRYQPDRDRGAALEILRNGLRNGPVPYTIHPGDWDWWVYHRGHDAGLSDHIAEHAVAEIAHAPRLISAFGCSVDACIELAARELGAGSLTICDVSAHDDARVTALEARGFRPTGTPTPRFERPTAGAVSVPVRNGFTIAPLGDDGRHRSRAAAARRAFGTDMPADTHAAR